MEKEIDFEKLRNDLIEHYKTFMVVLFPAAAFEIDIIEKANNYELLKIAEENGFELYDYEKKTKTL